ncbi:MAG: ATP phosphoribosyltransferase [Christensenellales bacterium]|jgi:ATP phosphoribosyltransferase
MLNIALPKGRLGKQVYRAFASAGYSAEGMPETDRRLVYENPTSGIRYFLVKPSDVATYVERGSADVGVVGSDVLMEQGPAVYELLDLSIGTCKIAVAAKNSFFDDPCAPLRVATKYPNIAREYFKKHNREIELILLHGSIELAPILGLSDVIVDIVETGTTLKENDLSVVKVIQEVSARLIANRTSYRFKQDEIARLVNKLNKGGEAT